jgi:hypothetical protein
MADTLTVRELNRATLARQLLLRRHHLDATQAVEHLVGLQTQIPHNHYTALWSRLDGFTAEDFSARFERREFVRISLQRTTIHTVTAADALALRPLLQDMHERVLRSSFGTKLGDLDLAAVVGRARVLLERQPMTFAELGRQLAEQWTGSDAHALAMAARNHLPLVQVPPRGLWQQGGLPRHTTAEHWLGAPLHGATVDELVLRYLAAFGPASVRDAQAWSGLVRLREVIERHRGELVVFRDERGVELFDLPDAPRPGCGVPAPVRFLPEYDNVFIGHHERTRIISEEATLRIWNSRFKRPVFLADGLVSGTWQLDADAKHDRTRLTITPLHRLTRAQRGELEYEGAALLAFHAPGRTHDIRWGTFQ